MGLHKGQTNNPAGRPPGVPNKITSDLRQRISDFLSDNWEDIQTEFKSLDTKDKLAFYEKLLQYGLPRLQATELTTTNSILEKLSGNQLDYIIQELKNESTI